MKMVITGSTGLVGKALVAELAAAGHHLVLPCRDVSKAERQGAPLSDRVCRIPADLESAEGWAFVSGAHAVIHLAGEPLAAQRWNSRVKQRLRDSRVESTDRLVSAIAALPDSARPRVLVVASGVDYYEPSDPSSDDHQDVDETAPAGESFLARLCREWEAAASRAESFGVRVVRMRMGIVLASGGALARMTQPFRWFVGGALGHGNQYFSWVHLHDAVRAYAEAASNPRWIGPINLVAPEAVRQRQVARLIGQALARPAWIPVPAAALRLAIGEFAEYLLSGRKVVPRRLGELGFEFQYPTLSAALESLDLGSRGLGKPGRAAGKDRDHSSS